MGGTWIVATVVTRATEDMTRRWMEDKDRSQTMAINLGN